MSDSPDATLSGTFLIGGEVPVHRLGFGAMRITGEGIWGPPADRGEAITAGAPHPLRENPCGHAEIRTFSAVCRRARLPWKRSNFAYLVA